MKTRNHNKIYSTSCSGRQFRLDVERIRRYVDKKMRRLPEGLFEIKLSCLGRGSTGHGTTCLTTVIKSTDPTVDTDTIMNMPGSAEKRAKKLRTILKTLWSHHARGTSWEDSRQIFKAVKEGAPRFEWWDEVAQCPFESSYLSNSDVSMRIYRHIAPIVYSISMNRA